ncbi:uncharacterized protein LOC129579596, partial [Sitodiplosis mosellana]|uniref:uncharacterized protein LOC129579596 n=1 Tax=Sitodiplosis mosellana TaxID=263140 RepID=UPI002443CC12
MPVGVNTKRRVQKAVIGDSVEIECDLDATKNSMILLFKNDEELNLTKDPRMAINGPKLEIKSVEMSDAGDYKCKSYEKYLIRVDSVTKLVLEQGLQNPDGIKSEMNMDCSGFKISWDPVEGNDIVQYHVHWRPNSTNEFFNFTTSETSATISDQFNENYIFKVVAANERGKSKADADVHAFEMNCDLKAFPLSTTAFLLQWQKPNFEIKGYKVFYQEHSETDGLGTKKERQPPIDQTLITQTKLTGLKPNTTYRLFIHTVDKENEDQVFKVIESKTLSTEPAGTPDKPTLTWMQMPTPKEHLYSNYVIRMNWHPNVDGNPGTNFTAKYRKKGDEKWNYTKRIDDEDFVIVDGVSVGSIYELAVVSVGYEGEENESDIAFGEIVDIDITRKKVDFELEGSEMELNCTIRHTNLKPLLDNPLVMVWESPNNNVARTDERIKQLDVIKENCDGERCDYIYRMMVSKLDKNKDSGDYRCNLTFDGTWILDSATIKVDKILDICSTFVNIKPVSTVNLTTNANETANWTAELIGYPNPSFDWRSNNGAKIPWGSESSNKSVSFTSTENGKIITLTLSNVTVRDSGIYTLYAENGNGEHNQIKSDFRLNVR